MTRKMHGFFALAATALACSSNAPEQSAGNAGAGGTAPSSAPTTGGTSANGGTPTANGGAPSAGNGGATSVTSGGATSQPGNGGTTQTGGSGGATSSPAGAGGTTRPGAGGVTSTGDAGSTSSGGSAGDGGSGGAAASSDGKLLVPHPSWTCGMADGIPPPTTGKLVLEANVTVGAIHDIGDTQFGHRHLVEITGGTVKGPDIDGTLRTGGLDWQLTLPNGAIEDEEVNIITTSSGAAIYFRNCGTAASSGDVVRTVPDFEAPNGGPYAFLNTAKLVGTRELDMTAKTLKLTVYDVSTAAPPQGDPVKVVEPDDLPDQTWDCKTAAGTKGAVVYMESVGIGAGSVTVGASKRGTRNIIPITGGTTTGRIAGSVLAGGADYQLIGTSFVLDARYTLHPGDADELIIVRNCGPVGALVPVFEARKDGKYAWVNDNHWLSSDPTVVPGAVNLTIYEGGQ